MSLSDQVIELSNNISKLYEKALCIKNDDEIVNLKKLRDREYYINILTLVRKNIDKIQTELGEKIDVLAGIHNEELNKVDNFISKLKMKKDTSDLEKEEGWQTIQPKSKKKTQMPISSDAVSKIAVSENYYLPAVKVADWGALTNMFEGTLYYVESVKHFAIKIAGFMYHGNIGIIYTNERDPVKIKDCRYSASCTKANCSYYHDPLQNSASSDRRNFIAGSWLYAPPGSLFKNKARARRLGSAENLDYDLPALTEEEARRFNDQVMHDLLCSLLIKRYKGE